MSDLLADEGKLTPSYHPQLSPCEWYNPWSTWHTRQNSPQPHRSQIFEILQDSIIDENTWENEMFNATKASEFEILKAETISAIPELECCKRDCKQDCATVCSVRLSLLIRYCRYLYAKGEFKFSYAPDLPWCISAMSKSVLSLKIDDVPFAISSILMCLSSQPEVELFYQAGILAYRTIEQASSYHLLWAWTLTFHPLFCNRFCKARIMIKEVIEDVSVLDYDPLDVVPNSPTNAEDLKGLLIFRGAAAQFRIMDWFEAHPRSRERVFGHEYSYGDLTRCLGVTINELHFCLGFRCSYQPGYHAREDLHAYELQWVDQHLWCNELHELLPLIVWQSFWRYLRDHGHLMENEESDRRLWNEVHSDGNDEDGEIDGFSKRDTGDEKSWSSGSSIDDEPARKRRKVIGYERADEEERSIAGKESEWRNWIELDD